MDQEHPRREERRPDDSMDRLRSERPERRPDERMHQMPSGRSVESNIMDIYVEGEGVSGFYVTVQPERTVRALKGLIYAVNGINLSDQLLVYHGRTLSNDDATLSYLGMKDYDKVWCFVGRRQSNSEDQPSSSFSPMRAVASSHSYDHSTSSSGVPSFDTHMRSEIDHASRSSDIPPPPQIRRHFNDTRPNDPRGKDPAPPASHATSSSSSPFTSSQSFEQRDQRTRKEQSAHQIRDIYPPPLLTPTPVEQSSPSDGEQQFLTSDETQERIMFWKKEAERGNFDVDTCIIDPLAHYSHLDYLEQSIVTSSEYYRCKGVYRIDNDNVVGAANTIHNVPNWMWDLQLNRPILTFTERHSERALQRQAILGNLWKTYLIVCQVLVNFDELKHAEFSRTFFSMLIKRPEAGIAELIKLPRSKLEDFKTGLESAISIVHSGVLGSKGTERTLSNMLAPGNWFLKETHMLGVSDLMTPGQGRTLFESRIAALLLDLALCSYVGSHGSPFPSYIGSNTDIIGMKVAKLGHSISVSCSLEPLACLDGFLDCKLWTFQVFTAQNPHRVGERDEKLSILTSMDLFADLWGPVWAAASHDHPGQIDSYILSRGFISTAEVAGQASQFHDVIPCHWSLSNHAGPSSFGSVNMPFDTRVLIGASLQEHPNCPYKPRHYEQDYGEFMGFLGTIDDTWSLDARTANLGLAHIAAIGIAGTQKKVPGVTLKELVFKAFSLNPETANIHYLDMFVGLEISHSTGNARRIKLKDFLCLDPIRKRLHANYPHWERTAWGQQFSHALQAPNFEAMKQLWEEQREMRKDISGLIAPILQLLHLTGNQGEHLLAAFLDGAMDQQMLLSVHKNEWAKSLAESRDLATYAVISGKCLEMLHHNLLNQTSCYQAHYLTALEVNVMFNRERPEVDGHVLLLPSRKLYKVLAIYPDNEIVLTPSLNMLMPSVKARIVITPRDSRRRLYSALIIASSPSYGGMEEKRRTVNVGHRANRNHRNGTAAQRNAASGVVAPRRGGANAVAIRNRSQPTTRKPPPPDPCCIIL